MTKEETLKRIEIMQAYCNGQQVQVLTPINDWVDIDEPNWKGLDYRIKFTPKYRPFSNMEECIQEMQKHPMPGWIKRSNYVENIVLVNNSGLTLADYDDVYSYESAVNTITFIDGTPFGILNEN